MLFFQRRWCKMPPTKIFAKCPLPHRKNRTHKEILPTCDYNGPLFFKFCHKTRLFFALNSLSLTPFLIFGKLLLDFFKATKTQRKVNFERFFGSKILKLIYEFFEKKQRFLKNDKSVNFVKTWDFPFFYTNITWLYRNGVKKVVFLSKRIYGAVSFFFCLKRCFFVFLPQITIIKPVFYILWK